MTSYIPDAVRHRVIEAFGNRCSYCLAAQRYVFSKLEIERIIPVTLGGSNDIVALFNPRTQAWSDHFQWGHH